MLTKLKEIVQEISQIPVLEEALACVAQRLVEVMQIDCCSVYLADYQEQYFRLVATDGLSADAVGRVTIGFSEGLIGLIGQREEPINVADAQAHPRFKHYPEVKEESYHAFLGTPIIHQRRVLGVISVQQKQRRKFSEQDEALLVTLAVQMALEIANAEARGVLQFSDSDVKTHKQRSIWGIPGSPGLAIGEGVVPSARAHLRDYVLRKSKNVKLEVKEYRAAVVATKRDIAELNERIEGSVPEDVATIFQMYDLLLDANSLGHEVEDKIKDGWDAASALKIVSEDYQQRFSRMSDPYMRERAIDVADLSNRVFLHLVAEQTEFEKVADEVILVADVVSAAMLAEYPAGSLKGIVSLKGATNSHTAILARAMGIPAVMGISDVPLSLFGGRQLILDGYVGEIKVNPDEGTFAHYKLLVEEEQELEQTIAGYADIEAKTQDGCNIELLINAGLSVELDANYLASGDGVGLYRTEIPFMQRERFPSEQEQVELYRQMLTAYPDKTVTMRTLDVGGDKPLPYLNYKEDNPFLGWRGIRVTLDHPEIFIVQVRAMLRASIGYSNLQIMLPMITSLSEVREAKRLISQAYYEVNEDAVKNGQVLNRPKVGIMLEVPAIIYQLPEAASLVDFFSIGSNDLTQYLLAVDRNNARVSSLYSSYHPSVLRVLVQIVETVSSLGKPITLCGEMASDAGGIVLLLAMGYRKLSVNGQNLAKAKWVISHMKLARAEQLLADVLLKTDPEEVQELLNLELENMGLGGLVRAGK